MTSSANPSFDSRIADWLEDGPDDAPAAVLETVLAATPSIPQRRELLAPRRLLPMLRIAALAAAIAVVVAGGILIAGGGRGLGPGSSPTLAAPTGTPTIVAEATESPVPRASMPPLSATFVSPWYGYTVAYPEGWQTTPGQGPWPLGENLQHGNPHLDAIISPVGLSMRLVGASIALPEGMGLSGFRAFASPQETNACTQLAPLPQPLFINYAIPEKSTLRVEALISLNGCHSLSSLGGNIYDVLVVAGGRGYDFTLDGDLTAAEAQAWLDSITLNPESALPASPGPS